MNRPVTRWVTYGAVPVVLLLAPLFLPLYRLNFDISTFLTVISLLFAILVGFFIASATTNYFRLQTLVAEENSGWISLYNLGILLDKSVKKKLSDAIDLYAIATLNFELMDYIERSLPAFQKVLKVVDAIRGRDSGTEALI